MYIIVTLSLQKQEEVDVEETDAIQTSSSEEPKMTTLNCSHGQRKHTAEYIITVSNKHGSDTASIEVVVLGELVTLFGE